MQKTTTTTVQRIKAGNILLPAAFGALQGKKPVFFTEFPGLWAKALFGRYTVSVTDARELVDEIGHREALARSGGQPDRMAIAMEEMACKTLGPDEVAIGWHVTGPGNLTKLILNWVNDLVNEIRQGPIGREAAMRSLGAIMGKIRYVEVLRLIRGLPIRVHGSVNGLPVDQDLFKGLALLGVTLTTQRPQDLLCESPVEDEELAGGNDISGWPQLFVPRSDYGQLSDFSRNNMLQFAGHIALQFKQGYGAELQLLAAGPGLKVMAVEADLLAGNMHAVHDQLKNTSVGQGVRGMFLVGDEVRTLPGANSKPEKCLNRNKLITGTGAEVLDRQASALHIQTELGVVPITEGVRIPVMLCNWAAHGSGQVFSRLDTHLTAAVTERQRLELTESEAAAVLGFCPEAGDIVEPGDTVVPGYCYAPKDSPVEVVGIDAEKNSFTGDWDVHIVWKRWVNQYNGFKLKGLGLKGSVMPLISEGSLNTDIFAALPGIDYIVNLEAAKGSAITLAMWAEHRLGLSASAQGSFAPGAADTSIGLLFTENDLTEEEMAEYQQWLDESLQRMEIKHKIQECLVEYYDAAGHTTVLTEDGWYVVQQVEYLLGHLVAEVEAPLVPHRVTKGALTLAQSMLMADEF